VFHSTISFNELYPNGEPTFMKFLAISWLPIAVRI